MARRRVTQRPDRAISVRGLRIRAGLLILIGFLAYANSLAGPFLMDDRRSIVDNPQIRRLWPLSIPLSPPDETPVARRPLVNLSFAINYAMGGLEVRGYHLLNVGLHVLTALVLFGIVRRTLSQPHLAGRFLAQSASLAWWTALIWLLHPLQTEAVNYVTQRSELMMGLFFLLTLYCAIRSADPGRQDKWQVASVLTCALGVACKESMAMAPLIVVLYDRIFLFRSLKASFGARWRLYAGLGASWVLLAALMSTGQRTSAGFGSGVSSWTYLLNQSSMIVQYLHLAVWPRALILDYGVPQALVLRDVLPSAVFVVCLILTTAVGLWWRPALGFLGVWFFITLAPASSIVPIATEVGAERRMYLPLAGLVVLGVIGARLLGDHLRKARFASVTNARERSWRMVGTTAPILLCTLLVAATVDRNREYRSALSMAQTIVDRRPHGRAHFSLGSELIAAGRQSEGMSHLWQSARDFPGARFALGGEMLAAGRPEEAIEQLQEFIRLQPSHINAPLAHELLGRAFIAQGNLRDAANQFHLLLKLAPRYIDAWGYLGDIFLAQRNFQDAVAAYQEFLKYRSGSARVLVNLGIALAASDRLDEATRSFQRAVDADAQYPDAHQNLAKAFLQAGEFRKAAESARTAVELQPDNATAHTLLGHALASAGQFDEALVEFRRALQLNPEDAEARNNVAAASRLRDAASRPR